MEIGLGALYSEQALASGVTTGKADLVFASVPYRIMHEFQIPLYDQMRERDKEFYDRLLILRREKSGGMEDILLAMATGYDYRKYQKSKPSK